MTQSKEIDSLAGCELVSIIGTISEEQTLSQDMEKNIDG